MAAVAAGASVASARRRGAGARAWRRPRRGRAVLRVAAEAPAAAAVSRRARLASFATAGYLLVMAVSLLAAPRPAFSLLFDAEALPEVWIRVFGLLCALLAWYYHGAASGRHDGFLRATVSGRLAFAAALTALVLCGGGPCGLLPLALVNALGALTMQRALSSGPCKVDLVERASDTDDETDDDTDDDRADDVPDDGAR